MQLWYMGVGDQLKISILTDNDYNDLKIDLYLCIKRYYGIYKTAYKN